MEILGPRRTDSDSLDPEWGSRIHNFNKHSRVMLMKFLDHTLRNTGLEGGGSHMKIMKGRGGKVMKQGTWSAVVCITLESFRYSHKAHTNTGPHGSYL